MTSGMHILEIGQGLRLCINKCIEMTGSRPTERFVDLSVIIEMQNAIA